MRSKKVKQFISVDQDTHNINLMNLITRSFFSFAKVGFVGLGNMGLPMAVNLAQKGHEVFAFDVDTSKQSQTKRHNITFRPEVKSIAKDADIFVTMLPNSEHSQSVCQSEGGLFKNAKAGSLIIDSSTIAPKVAIALNETAKNHKMTYVDAPVSGGVTGAAAGTLTFMVGAEDNVVFERCKPILEAMGKNIFNCQKAGAGQITKVCNNMALAIEMIGISQALALGNALGMDLHVLTNIMKVSTARCWSIDTYNPVPGVMQGVPASRDYEGGFGCALMLKDLGLALEAAEQVGSTTQLGNKSKEIYVKLSRDGYGRKDFGVIYDVLSKKKL